GRLEPVSARATARSIPHRGSLLGERHKAADGGRFRQNREAQASPRRSGWTGTTRNQRRHDRCPRRAAVAAGEAADNRFGTGATMNVQALLDAINYQGYVSGLTHNFYRYPARFSPRFARGAIEAFSERGDVILDPFMGGATTLVEARALG